MTPGRQARLLVPDRWLQIPGSGLLPGFIRSSSYLRCLVTFVNKILGVEKYGEVGISAVLLGKIVVKFTIPTHQYLRHFHIV